MIINIIHEGDICPINQKYINRQFSLSPRYRNFKSELGYKAKISYKGPILTQDVCLYIKLYYPRTIDIDSVLKPTMDALNGIIWKDDKQVTELFVRKKKHDKKDYRIEIKVVQSGHS